MWKVTQRGAPGYESVVRDAMTNQQIAIVENGGQDHGYSVTWSELHDLNTNGLNSKDIALGYVLGVKKALLHSAEPPQVLAAKMLAAHQRAIPDADGATSPWFVP